jgi:hypothetical protein
LRGDIGDIGKSPLERGYRGVFYKILLINRIFADVKKFIKERK